MTQHERDAYQLAVLVNNLQEHEKQLVLTIMELIAGNPARREFARSWQGRVQDLPAALRMME